MVINKHDYVYICEDGIVTPASPTSPTTRPDDEPRYSDQRKYVSDFKHKEVCEERRIAREEAHERAGIIHDMEVEMVALKDLVRAYHAYCESGD